jgi:hypothetical protein
LSDQQSDLYDYDGFIIPRDLSAESLSALNLLAKEHPDLIDVYPSGTFEFRHRGRDSGQLIVRMLKEIAAVVGDADGEVVCEINVEGGDPLFEFYRFRGGQLFRQRGRIVREPEEAV